MSGYSPLLTKDLAKSYNRWNHLRRKGETFGLDREWLIVDKALDSKSYWRGYYEWLYESNYPLIEESKKHLSKLYLDLKI